MTAFRDLSDNFGFTETRYKEVLAQYNSESTIAETFMLPKWELWRKRVKLLNNQKRSTTDIGDPLAFPIFQTILASLHTDKLKTRFVPREEGDNGVASNLNPLYEYDAVIMDKSRLDYQWLYNTLFFGHSLCYMFEFDRKTKTPKPEVINMMTYYRDPNATSVNGDASGRGAMRFGGRPILLTKRELKKAGVYKNIDLIQEGDNINDALSDTSRKVKKAQGFTSTSSSKLVGENNQLTIMEWLTFLDGKRVVIGVANGGTLLVRFTELKDQEEWGIIEQQIYPDSFSWDGVSVMDLLEDKQRARARILNAALFSVEANSNNMYLYDVTKINSESDLNFAPNKHIGVTGDPSGAVQAIPRQQVANEVKYILDVLSTQAEKATAASEIKQGALAGSGKTATEIATVSEGADTRFSLSSRIIGWSEKAFARYWYKMYKMHFTKGINEKVLRINGLNGALGWRKLGKDNIISEVDPDISVESELVTEAQRLRKLQNFTNSYEILAADPATNKQLLTRKNAELNGWTETEMMHLFPLSADQILQQEENKSINDGKNAPINATDDDMVHLAELQKAVDGPAKYAHERAHIKQIVVKSKNQNVQGEAQALAQQQGMGKELGQAPNIGSQNFNSPSTLNTAKQV